MDYEYEYVPNFDVDMYDDYDSQPLSQPSNSQPLSQLPSSSTAQQPIIEEENDSQSSNFQQLSKFPSSSTAQQPIIEEENNFQPSTSKFPSSSTTKLQPIIEENTKNVQISIEKTDNILVPFESPPKKSKKVEVFKTPINAAPPSNIHAKFSMKIIKTQAITPLPNYSSMLDEELNDHLDKFGIRPMGRKRAIEELTRIYEATHPIIDEKNTPTRERIWNAISEFNERPKKKAASRKRPAPIEFDKEVLNIAKPPTFETIIGNVLNFLRLPQNSELYNECLLLKSIMLDRLMKTFASFLSENSISKDVFIRILDHLHITYSDKRDENNHYYQ